MKELTEKSKQTLKLILAEKGFKNVEVDAFGNVIEVSPKTGLRAIIDKDKQSGKIVTTLTELSSKAMGLDYDPNEIVKNLAAKWVKDEM